MRKRSVVSRILLYGVAVVQMAAPVLAVVADARLVGDSAGALQVHVEDHTQKSCRPAHPDDCALCQLLTHFSAPRESAPPLPTAALGVRSILDHALLLPVSAARAQARTRAPPVSLS